MKQSNKIKFVIVNPFSTFVFYLNSFLYQVMLRYKKKLLYEKYDIHLSIGVHLETYIYGAGQIKIGENTYFGKNTFVVSNPKTNIINIGKNCRISQGVHLRTEDNSPDTLYLNNPLKIGGDITIGNNCWIGANCFIRGGVHLGDNVAVGANSVVTKSFPSNVVIAGVPAKIIRKI